MKGETDKEKVCRNTSNLGYMLISTTKKIKEFQTLHKMKNDKSPKNDKVLEYAICHSTYVRDYF